MTLENPSNVLAFFVHLPAGTGTGGEEVLPVRWEDNRVTLLPGETRNLAATHAAKDLGGAAPAVTIDGWNVAGATVK